MRCEGVTKICVEKKLRLRLRIDVVSHPAIWGHRARVRGLLPHQHRPDVKELLWRKQRWSEWLMSCMLFAVSCNFSSVPSHSASLYCHTGTSLWLYNYGMWTYYFYCILLSLSFISFTVCGGRNVPLCTLWKQTCPNYALQRNSWPNPVTVTTR